MQAYKGVTKGLRATFGKSYQFEEGKTYVENYSKTASTGFHCAENPVDCLKWYNLGEDKIFLVTAAGSLDECDYDSRIACTEITLEKELSISEFAMHVMQYMILHPKREWKANYARCSIEENEAVAEQNGIAIARGSHPRVKGKKGSILGIMVEPKPGVFEIAKLGIVGKQLLPDTWYTVSGKEWRKEDEEKAG